MLCNRNAPVYTNENAIGTVENRLLRYYGSLADCNNFIAHRNWKLSKTCNYKLNRVDNNIS